MVPGPWRVDLSLVGVSNVSIDDGPRTLLHLGRDLCGQVGLFKGPPFEVLFVAAAGHRSLRTLFAGGFRLVALEPLRFARYAT